MFGPTIYINSGSIDLHAKAGTQPTELSEMTLNESCKNVLGYDDFGKVIPDYICTVQNSGDTTEIILDGLNAEDLGEIE